MVIAENIPEELKERDQWVVWRGEPDSKNQGKITKIPINPHNGKNADTTKPDTWGHFELALSFYLKKKLSGVGYVFSREDSLTGIDLDQCLTPKNKKLKTRASSIVQKLDSYTEITPGGAGLHIIARGAKPGSRCKKGTAGIEMYDTNRFFTVTGNVFSDKYGTIEERPAEIAALYYNIFGDGTGEDFRESPESRFADLSDQELVKQALAAKNGEKFRKLWCGDWSDYPSQSEADLALVSMLAYWTGNDPDRIDSLFRQSGLYREKWDSRRGDSTYGKNLITLACEEVSETYSTAKNTEKGSDKKRNGKAKSQRAATKSPPRRVASAQLGDCMIELCYDSARTPSLYFCVYNGREIKYVRSYRHNGIRYVPVDDKNGMVEKGVVVLPSKAESYGSLNNLITRITDFIHKYLAVSPLFEKICAYYIVFCWLYDRFNVLPYLRFLGDYGTGKTTGLITLGYLSYRAIFAGGAITPSPIFRLMEKFQGTFVLDEADFKDSETYAAVIKILNNGYQRGFPVLRSETVGNRIEPKAYPVFGPKIIATRTQWKDRALESRCLTEEMDGKYRGDIEDIDEGFYEEALDLRNQLLMFRIQHYQQVKIDYSLKDSTIEPRLNQIMTPLLSIVDDKDLREELRKFVRTYNTQIIEDRGLTLTAYVVEALSDLYNEKTTDLAVEDRGVKIHIKELCDYINENIDEALLENPGDKITPQLLGRIVKKYLKLTARRDTSGMYLSNLGDKLSYLKKRFGVRSHEEDEGGEVPF